MFTLLDNRLTRCHRVHKSMWHLSDGRFHGQYYANKYKRLRNELVMDLRAAKSYYLAAICQSPTSSSTWKLVQTTCKPSTSIPDLVVNNELLASDSDKATALNLHFSRCFNYSVPPLRTTESTPFTESSNLQCSTKDIYEIIHSWNSNFIRS